MFFKVLTFLCPLVALTYGGDPVRCDKIEPIQNFDAKKTEGVWYVQEVGEHGVILSSDCGKLDITGLNNIKGSTRVNGDYKYVDLPIIQEGNTSKYNLPKKYYGASASQIWVATDYDNYFIQFDCVMRTRTAIILSTRTRDPGAQIMEKAKEEIKKNGFNTDKMTAMNHNGCTN